MIKFVSKLISFGNKINPSSDIIDCPKGRYCKQGTKFPELCPPGTYNPIEGISDVSACLDCPEGYYCPGFGNNATQTGFLTHAVYNITYTDHDYSKK